METTNRPRCAVGIIVMHDSKVLLVKRKNPPNQGLWTIPGGKIHWGESIFDAAQREIIEETGLVVQALFPLYCFDLCHQSQFHYVIIDVVAEYLSGELSPGDDAEDACWFSQAELLKQSNLEPRSASLLRAWFERGGEKGDFGRAVLDFYNTIVTRL